MRGFSRPSIRVLSIIVLVVALAGTGIMIWSYRYVAANAAGKPDTLRDTPVQEQAGGAGDEQVPVRQWPWPAATTPPLLSGNEDWGTPPVDAQIAMPLGELPPYSGWYRYLNAGWYNGGLCTVTSGLLIAEANGVLHAISAVSGKEQWHAKYDGVQSYNWMVAGDNMLYMDYGNCICAAELRNGTERWRSEEIVLLAGGTGGVWGCKWQLTPDYFEQVTGLRFLDARSGKVTASYDFAPTPKWDYRLQQATDYIALKQDAVTRVYSRDGKTLDLSMYRADWQVCYGYMHNGVVIAELAVPDLMDMAEDSTDEDFERREKELLLDPKTGKAGPGAIVQCYSLPAGKLLWRRELSVEQMKQYCSAGNEIPCCEGYALFKSSGMLALRLADGSVAAEIPLQENEYISSSFNELGPDNDGIIYLEHTYETGTYLDCLIAAKLGQTGAVKQRLGLPDGIMQNYSIAGGYLVGMYETDGLTRASGTNRALIGMKLEPQGGLAAGRMKVLEGPQLPDALRKRFLESADPGRDADLLRAVATAGVGAIIHIARGVRSDQAAHLDALMALAVYNDKQCKSCSSGQACELLCPQLAGTAQPVMSPQVIRWLSDASLSSGREFMLDLLARCGGPEAKRVLDQLYDAGQEQRYQQLPTPYSFTRADLENPSDDDYVKKSGTWIEAKGWGRSRFAVFPSAGLLNSRFLYLAVDKANDGIWEELLPTGLQDSSFYYMHPVGATGPGPKGQLALSMNYGKVRITHHRPVYKEESYGEGENKQTYMAFSDAQRVDTVLKLDDLRKDSDKDGLTDITEQMLLTDLLKADSDGDGLPDASDATPLADPSQMGKVERGIVRAMKRCLEGHRICNESNEYISKVVYPWNARIFTIYGTGPVAYCNGQRYYCISLNSRELRQAYEKLLDGYPASGVRVTYWLKGMSAQEELEASGRADTAEGGVCASGISASTGLGGLERDAAIVMEVRIDFSTAGFMVQLVEIEGEYYPAAYTDTWIS